MTRVLTFDGVRYLMRDQRSKAEILRRWAAFQAKYSGTKTTFREWLKQGTVYTRLPARTK